MKRKQTHLTLYALLIVNLYFAYLTSTHEWSLEILNQWGGMSGLMPNSQQLIDFPPFSGLNISAQPQWLLTTISGIPLIVLRALYSSFLHASWSHVASNMIVLYFIGKEFDRTNYTGLLLPVYMFTGVISMLSAYILNPQNITVGASGAVFGIMATMVVLGKRASYRKTHTTISNYSYYNYINASKSVYTLLVFNIITSFVIPGISIVGHISGAIAGVIIGIVIPLKDK